MLKIVSSIAFLAGVGATNVTSEARPFATTTSYPAEVTIPFNVYNEYNRHDNCNAPWEEGAGFGEPPHSVEVTVEPGCIALDAGTFTLKNPAGMYAGKEVRDPTGACTGSTIHFQYGQGNVQGGLDHFVIKFYFSFF